MLSKKFQKVVYTDYAPMTRKEVDLIGLDTNSCLFCGAWKQNRKSLWCSEDCQSQYLVRARMEDLRAAVHERDCAVCEVCGTPTAPYVLACRVALKDGGGAAGIDGTRTMCEPCLLCHAGEIRATDYKNPPMPTVLACRKLWKTNKRRGYRYALGPFFASAMRWHRILVDYRNGAIHLRQRAAIRTREHHRITETTLRWWRIVASSVKPRVSKKKPVIVVETLKMLEDQFFATSAWLHHWRLIGEGVLD